MKIKTFPNVILYAFYFIKAGATIAPRPGDEMSRLPFLRTWLRTRNAIILHLSNGTIQVILFI